MSRFDKRQRSATGMRYLSPVLAILGMLTLAACATGQHDGASPDSTNRPEQSAEMSETLRELRKSPRFRDAIAVLCRESLAKPQDASLEPFLASFLNVPPARAKIALCGALFEMIAANELTDEDIDSIAEAGENRDYALIGGVLRKLLIAHQRLTTQQVSRPSLGAGHAEKPKGWPVANE